MSVVILYIITLSFCFSLDECRRSSIQHNPSKSTTYGAIPVHSYEWCSALRQQASYAHCAL